MEREEWLVMYKRILLLLNTNTGVAGRIGESSLHLPVTYACGGPADKSLSPQARRVPYTSRAVVFLCCPLCCSVRPADESLDLGLHRYRYIAQRTTPAAAGQMNVGQCQPDSAFNQSVCYLHQESSRHWVTPEIRVHSTTLEAFHAFN
jgi:hypothetical protein